MSREEDDMPQDESTKFPPPCEDCGDYHSQAERDAFERAQQALRRQMAEIIDRHARFFDELCARLQLATGDPFEATVVITFVVGWLVQQTDESVFNRLLDTLLDTQETSELMKLVRGKKVADA